MKELLHILGNADVPWQACTDTCTLNILILDVHVQSTPCMRYYTCPLFMYATSLSSGHQWWDIIISYQLYNFQLIHLFLFTLFSCKTALWKYTNATNIGQHLHGCKIEFGFVKMTGCSNTVMRQRNCGASETNTDLN